MKPIRVNVTRGTLPEANELFDEFTEAFKKLKDVEDKIVTKLQDSALGKQIQAMVSMGIKNLQIQRSIDQYGVIFLSIPQTVLNRDWGADDEELGIQSMHPSTLNLILNSKWASENEKRKLVGLPQKEGEIR